MDRTMLGNLPNKSCHRQSPRLIWLVSQTISDLKSPQKRTLGEPIRRLRVASYFPGTQRACKQINWYCIGLRILYRHIRRCAFPGIEKVILVTTQFLGISRRQTGHWEYVCLSESHEGIIRNIKCNNCRPCSLPCTLFMYNRSGMHYSWYW